MKRCPTCQRTYDDMQTYCVEDGAVLLADYGTSPSGNPTNSRPEPPPTVYAPMDALYPAGDYVPPEAGISREPSAPDNPYGSPSSSGGYNSPSQPGYGSPSSPSGGYNSPSQPGYAPPPASGYTPNSWQDTPAVTPNNYAPMANPHAMPPTPNNYTPPPMPNYAPSAGLDQSLAVASVVCGGLSFVCFGMLLGIPAIITGVMARKRIQMDPARYTGGGLAMAGIVLGGISTVLSLLWILVMLIGAISR